MTKYATYTYAGGDNHYGLENGKQYKLALYKMSWFERLFSKYPVGWGLVVYRPFDSNTCLMPYANVAEFESNWEKIEEHHTSKVPLIPAH